MSESSSRRSNLDPVFSDDIEVICAQVGFDPTLYVEFPREKRGSAAAVSAPAPASGPESVPPMPVSQPAAPFQENVAAPMAEPPLPEPRRPMVSSLPQPQVFASRESPAPLPQPLYIPQPRPMAVPSPEPQPVSIPNAIPTPRQFAVQGLRAGLRALLDELGVEEKDTTEEHRPRRRARAVVVAPAASGMGCTTLTATLARHYRTRGEGVLIFDDREDGLLRLHFQAADSIGIPIVGRESANTLAATWYSEPMTRYQTEYQWYVMDTEVISRRWST